MPGPMGGPPPQGGANQRAKNFKGTTKKLIKDYLKSVVDYICPIKPRWIPMNIAAVFGMFIMILCRYLWRS